MNNTRRKNIREFLKFAAVSLSMAAVSIDAASFPSGYYAGDSRLKEGRWVRIKVRNTGMHQITESELREMGFQDPSKVAVFGFPAVALSDYKLTDRTPDDLPPVPAVMHGGKLIFYGEADTRDDLYQAGSADAGISYPVKVTRNFYADFGTYFLTDAYAGTAPREIPAAGNAEAGLPVVTGGYGMVRVEEETSNKGEIGPFFFGRSFVEERRQEYTFTMPGFRDGTGIFVRMAAPLQLSLAGNLSIISPSGATSQLNVPTSSISSYVYNGMEWTGMDYPQVSPDGNYRMVFDASTIPYINFGALDYFTVTYERDNIFRGGQQRMVYTRLQEGSRIQIPTSVSRMMVWNVSDPFDICRFELADAPEGAQSGGEKYIREISSPQAYSALSGKPASIIAFDPESELYHVEFDCDITCQNLHAAPVPEMVIISSRRMLGESERLAQAHRDIDGMDVAVVCQDDVYNEFSSGTPHVMGLRRFVKMLYDREPGKLRSVLLFGAASYDCRDIPNGGRQVFRDTHIPIIQQEDFRLSGHRSKSYISDSFVGMMEEDNANDPFNIYRRHMDVNVARIPTDNLGDAAAVVDKTIRYMSAPPHVRSVNSALLMCDKGDAIGHMSDAEMLDSVIAGAAPSTVVYKGYNTLFPKQNGHADELHRYISNMLSKGVGYWAYSGHATPYSFGAEPIWDISLIQQTDYDIPPFTVFATCRALYFDHPGGDIGEAALYKPKGGSIAVIGALREVYKEKNLEMNLQAGKYFFTASEGTTAGDVFRLARRSSVSTSQSLNNDLIINTLSYNLIGDPEVKIHRPQLTVNITAVNGREFDYALPMTLPSASEMVIDGFVAGADGNIASDFTGNVTLSLFDGSRNAKVVNVGNAVIEQNWLGYEVPMADEIIFETVARVEKGRFRLSAVMPAPQRPGSPNRIVFAVASDDNAMRGATSLNNITVEPSGVQPEITDETLPEITRMYIDDATFADGDLVGGDFMFHAEVGPNPYVVAGHSALLGQSVTLMLDGSRSFTDAPLAFVAQAGGGGTLDLPLTEIADGPHTLTLKVRNYAGQTAERTINFTVVNMVQKASLSVEEYPASEVATINLDCNLRDKPVARLIVKDAAGKVVFTDTGVTFPYRWDLRTGTGKQASDGLYTVEAYFNSGLRYGAATPASVVVRR